jgi:hypothetical protein
LEFTDCRCAQSGRTPLFSACQKGHVVVVELLLEQADLMVNKAHAEVREGEAGRERKQEGQAGVHHDAAVEAGSSHSCVG